MTKSQCFINWFIKKSTNSINTFYGFNLLFPNRSEICSLSSTYCMNIFCSCFYCHFWFTVSPKMLLFLQTLILFDQFCGILFFWIIILPKNKGIKIVWQYNRNLYGNNIKAFYSNWRVNKITSSSCSVTNDCPNKKLL